MAAVAVFGCVCVPVRVYAYFRHTGVDQAGPSVPTLAAQRSVEWRSYDSTKSAGTAHSGVCRSVCIMCLLCVCPSVVRSVVYTCVLCVSVRCVVCSCVAHVLFNANASTQTHMTLKHAQTDKHAQTHTNTNTHKHTNHRACVSISRSDSSPSFTAPTCIP